MELQSPPPPFFVSAHTDELIYSILLRLPAKSLLKFRCVCKNWDSIIRSQTFKLNYSFSRPQGYLFLHFLQDSSIPCYTLLSGSSFSEISELEIPSNFSPSSHNPEGRIVVVGSCNGLFCITNSKQFGRELYIWNPSIRKHEILTTTSLRRRVILDVELPIMSSAVAMGFDSKTNDYKILRISSFNLLCRVTPIRLQAEIFSLSTDSWKPLKIPDDLRKRVSKLKSREYVYIDGGFHWSAIFANEEGMHYSSILRFDVTEERFKEVKLQNGDSSNIVNNSNNWVMNGSLWNKEKVEFEGMRLNCECVIEEGESRVSLIDPQTLHEKTVIMDILNPASVHAFAETLALL